VNDLKTTKVHAFGRSNDAGLSSANVRPTFAIVRLCRSPLLANTEPMLVNLAVSDSMSE